MKRFLFIAALFFVAACQSPTTYTPSISEQELEQERIRQQHYATQAEIERDHKSQLRRMDMEQRLLRVAKPVAQAGAELCVQIRPAGSPCVFGFYMERSRGEPEDAPPRAEGINAYADGENIFVTPGMMRFIRSDEELAMVLSHELAHNIMGHVSSQQVNSIAGAIAGLALDTLAASQGYNTQGGFTNLGSGLATAAYSVEFEKEADYVGLYIMSQSGYDVNKAENFWRRFAVKVPEAMQTGISHPSTPERFVAMQKTIYEINYKRKQGIPLIPDFIEQ